MSTIGARDYRPKLHFTPKTGWINDPNGLLYVNGQYHLFAQYYPHDTKWGPMHWLHAISYDLINWEHIGIALEPDEELGFIFSGSAIIDKGNTSGLGVPGCDAFITMFTHHGETEQQSIAYSLDGVHFTKYAHNPVIPNPGAKDFRDPKVFRNEMKDCWSVVLAAGDHVEFYSSHDFIHWEKTGTFGPVGNHCVGVWECPDLFPLETADGNDVWVLLVSMGQPIENGGGRTQYFLGSFDGDSFHCTMPFDDTEWIDAGFDNYAGVTFNSELQERILIGWGINWVYAQHTPTNEYCGNMTLARKLSLVDTPKGLRLASSSVGLDEYLGNPIKVVDGFEIPDETFSLHIEAHGAVEIILKNDENEKFSFGIDTEDRIYTDRSLAGESDFNPHFVDELRARTVTQRLFEGSTTMDLVFDVSVAELFADLGTYANSTVFYPTKPYTRIKVSGQAEVTYYPIRGF